MFGDAEDGDQLQARYCTRLCPLSFAVSPAPVGPHPMRAVAVAMLSAAPVQERTSSLFQHRKETTGGM